MGAIARASDFLVVGGGPAGCSFAILAARSGAFVTLVERTNYRQKRPGEYLAGRTRTALDRLQVLPPARTTFASSSPGILSLWNGSVPVTKAHAAYGERDALCVTRHLFDEILIESARAAGVEVVTESILGSIERDSGGPWQVELEGADAHVAQVRARSLVDASGRSSVVARRQGARRINSGDLIAIVGWLESLDAAIRPAALLTIESCSLGWWSLSTAADGTVVATLYTSSHMMRSARVTPEEWWALALEETRNVGQAVSACGGTEVTVGVFPAFPSRSSQVCGNGWIAVGDAAIALDPIAGKGVAIAMETAFRAFEAAMVDPSWASLGADYADALEDRFARHLAGRARVYEEAASVFADQFLRYAVPELPATAGA